MAKPCPKCGSACSSRPTAVWCTVCSYGVGANITPEAHAAGPDFLPPMPEPELGAPIDVRVDAKDLVEHLSTLGAKETVYPGSPENAILEVFANPKPERRYKIQHHTDEFTSLCPKTGQPDFATILIEYIASETCVESKSLKLYLFSFRNQGAFMERLCNRILDDLVTCCKPIWMEITMSFGARGGIKTVVKAEHSDAGRVVGFEHEPDKSPAGSLSQVI